MNGHNVAVLGAGIMGRGIAYAAALGGFHTVLQDSSEQVLEKAAGEIWALLEKGVATNKVDDQLAAAAQRRLASTRTLEEAVKSADLVIEAVPERMDLKIEMFAAVDRAAPPHAILASNTSSLSITEMAAATHRPAQVVGMHFFNPVHRMKLLEVVRALETSERDDRRRVRRGRERWGRSACGARVAGIRDQPHQRDDRQRGVLHAAGRRGERADIDQALKLGLNHPMGPFELVDLVGLDTRLAILKFLHRTLGEKFRPCPLIEQYVAAGRLGRKSGRGVYDYPERPAAR